VKKLGAEDKRFGSVSIPIKKFASGMGNTYLHWMTLFENLADDGFDGQLGEDEGDFPRVMVEYSVVGGKYTSLVNDMDRFKEHVGAAEQEAGGMAADNF
jgi:hypothetical protein